MTREDIIRMAQEAGFIEDMISLGEALVWEAEPKNLERFAALAAEWGAKQEREACAKVCEEATSSATHSLAIVGVGFAELIRKRGEVKP